MYDQKANSALRECQRWLDKDPERATMFRWLFGIEEFSPVAETPHPAVAAGRKKSGNFLTDMQYALQCYGRLTGPQEAATMSMMSEAMRAVGEQAARDAGVPTSEWVGTPGRREELHLTVERVAPYRSSGGYEGYVNTCETMDENMVVYIGSNQWVRGQYLVVMALIAQHNVYQGVKQTLIRRPRIIEARDPL